MNIVLVTRGSDVSLTLTWSNPDGSPLDLTGYTTDLFDLAEGLTGLVSTEIVAPASGGITTVNVEGSAPLDVGDYEWRVRITSLSGDTLATSPIILRVL